MWESFLNNTHLSQFFRSCSITHFPINIVSDGALVPVPIGRSLEVVGKRVGRERGMRMRVENDRWQREQREQD